MSRSVQLAMMLAGALMLAAPLTLSGCQSRPAQGGLPKSPAAQTPAAQTPAAQTPAEPATKSPPPAPSPVPFRPVPPGPPAVAPVSAPAKPATNAAKIAPKTTTPAPKPASPASPASALPASPASPASPATLDLDSLEQRLKDTRAIGVFTKLSLKNQVNDLLDELREFHKGALKQPQSVLRQKYDLLIMKVLSLLQNGDPPLASAISSSREAIWQILMDPSKFAKI